MYNGVRDILLYKIRDRMGKVRAVDLFCGAGGFSLAALNSDVTLLAAVELDDYACDTYRENIVKIRSPETKIFNEDIFGINIDEFASSLNIDDSGLDILMGGPPCQGFSTHRINNKGVDDPRNKLLLHYFEFINKLKPKVFIVENVPGLLWERHKSYLEDFNVKAKESGYKVLEPVKLNAKDYGVPQSRVRVFILGIREDIVVDESLWPPKPTHFKPTLGKPEWKKSAEVFEKPTEEVIKLMQAVLTDAVVNSLTFGSELLSSDIDTSAIHMNHTDALMHRFALTPINGSRDDIDFKLPCHDNNYNGHKDVYGRIRLAKPGPTITTGCFNPSKGRFLHPWKDHGITIRHAARMQTFPDDYIFKGGITHQGKQVGNAVPVKMGEVIIKTVLNMIT
ncbi:Modification methylase HaeIII [Serratia quinivorans]|nr:DNA cytosine methyltransferase [Serratia quinivorans]CAI1795905.1 Modification methylase HaeIII [Serratia quinivorans]CAI1819189.1 Modification methylase HaeIII [Serratia quinivorans]